MSDAIGPFQLDVPEAQLDALRDRPRHTRWPDRGAVADTSQGPPLHRIRALVRELVRISRRCAEKRFGRLVHFNGPDAGGHFAAMEQPGLPKEEIRAGFRGLRR